VGEEKTNVKKGDSREKERSHTAQGNIKQMTKGGMKKRGERRRSIDHI